MRKIQIFSMHGSNFGQMPFLTSPTTHVMILMHSCRKTHAKDISAHVKNRRFPILHGDMR